MSISNEEVVNLINSYIPDSETVVEGDGYKYQAKVISSTFAGLSQVKRQQLVYAALNDVITSGELHALTIKAYTPDEV